MIPYGKHSLDEEDFEAVREALNSEYITQGPRVDSFEQKIREHFDCKHAIAVNNGTTALLLAYQALGLSEGDKFITTPNTFAATANAGVFLGAEPVFLDIDPETFTLPTDRVEEYLKNNDTSSLAGVTTVHFAGYPAELERLSRLADEHDLFLLEDACHAPGAEWTDSNDVSHTIGSCDFSDAAILSFHPVKHFTTGEGGAVLTNDDELADSIRGKRHHGITKNKENFTNDPDGPWYYEMQSLGINGRITDFQCALGISQMDKLDQFLQKRREIADRYRSAFNGMVEIQCQKKDDGRENAYHLFVVRAEDRTELFRHLKNHEIAPQVHYIPVHRHPYYQDKYGYEPGDFPQADEYYDQALSLPIYPTLDEKQQEHVINTIKEFYS